MIIKSINELKNPSRVKVVPWCDPCQLYVRDNNCKRAYKLIKILAENYNIFYQNISNKIEIYSEKEYRKEIMIEVKQWEF